MGNTAERWAYAQQIYPPSAKQVLCALAWHQNQKTGRCDPTVEMLRADTGLSKPTIADALATLEALGLIAITRGHGYVHNQYTLYIKAISKVKPVDFESAIKVKPVDFETENQSKRSVNQSKRSVNQSKVQRPDYIIYNKKNKKEQEGGHTQKTRGEKLLVVSEAFIEQMIAEFSDLGAPEEIRLEINFALSHASARKWRGPPELGVKRWLLRNRKWGHNSLTPPERSKNGLTKGHLSPKTIGQFTEGKYYDNSPRGPNTDSAGD